MATEKSAQDDHTTVTKAASQLAVEIVEAPKTKRLCRYPGCNKVIKSQGHCQRHGAKAKRCRVEGCDKQAQGTHDGMCKRHWKAVNFPEAPAKKEEQPPPPEGESVYDSILPLSIAFRPPAAVAVKYNNKDEKTAEPIPEGVNVMPLVKFLREGANKEAGWHRNGERRARGMFPLSSLSSQLESWERQLALVEILLLSGGTQYANFKDLAHAWGRERGFHQVLATSVCERRGEVERKRRADAALRHYKLKKPRIATVEPKKAGQAEATLQNGMDKKRADDEVTNNAATV